MNIIPLILLALAPVASAQIKTGKYTDGQGHTVKVEVSDTNGTSKPGVDVTVTDAGGSRVVVGVQATGSTDENPKAKSFAAGFTPRGNMEVKGEDGKVKYKNAAGNWIILQLMQESKSPLAPYQTSTGVPSSLNHSAPQSGGSLPQGPQKL